MCACVNLCWCMCAYACVHMHMCVLTYTNIYVYIYIYVSTRIFIYLHIYIDIRNPRLCWEISEFLLKNCSFQRKAAKESVTELRQIGHWTCVLQHPAQTHT